MTRFTFNSVLFYAAYICLAARQAPATAVPAFQCSVLSISNYQKSVSSLHTGFSQASKYINTDQLTPGECSPPGARLSVFNRVGATENSFTLNLGFAIFRAYSTIANLASQSDTVSEADQAKMQIVHELLNSLISNYYEVVSPDHCSCGIAPSDSCVTIPNLDYLALDTYPDSCSPAAYVSINLVGEFQRLLVKFTESSVFLTNFDPLSTSCQQWKDDYLPRNSSAASVVSC